MYYLIDTEQNKSGPYDIVWLIKKARNRKLEPHTLLEDAEQPLDQPIPANLHPALKEIFAELHEQSDTVEEVNDGPRKYSFTFLLKMGLESMLNSQSLVLYASTFVLFCAAPLASLLWMPWAWYNKILAAMLCTVIGIVALSFCLLAQLKQHRGQPVDKDTILQQMKEHQLPLLKSAVIIGLLTATGLLCFIVPGIFVLCFTIYVPMLIADQKQSLASAMVLSRKRVQQLGGDNIGVIFGLIAINVLAAPLIFPLVFTLPITLSGLVTIYDEQMF